MKFFILTTSLSFEMVQSSVLGPGHHSKIFWAVVPFIVVYMVHYFIGEQRAAQYLLRYYSVL